MLQLDEQQKNKLGVLTAVRVVQQVATTEAAADSESEEEEAMIVVGNSNRLVVSAGKRLAIRQL